LDHARDVSTDDAANRWTKIQARFDVVADLIGAPQRALPQLLRDRLLYEQARHLTIALDKPAIDDVKATGYELLTLQSPHDALSTAIALAATARSHLLVLFGGAVVDSDVIGSMLSVFAADPMIGYVVPRFADPSGDQIVPLGQTNGLTLGAIDRRILSHLPNIQLAPEFLAACILIRDQLVTNFPLIGRGSWSAEGALLMAMTATRRWGFRTAVANKVVTAHPLAGPPYPKLTAEEFQRICEHSPHVQSGVKRFDALAIHQKEALLGRALSPDRDQRQRLILDCSNIGPFFNGTAEAILGILDGIAALDPPFSIDVTAHDEAAKYHRMPERYPQFRFLEKPVRGGYLAAIRLSQPWAMITIAQLHEQALYVVATILDTIWWDIINSNDDEVERTWTFAARYLDGLIFNSGFSRDRFRERFPVASHVRELISHHSFQFDEYLSGNSTERQAGAYILVVGNSYEHKALAPTLDVLADAFPYEHFTVIGMESPGRSNVVGFVSGSLSSSEVERIYANARILVFPSFYEGFGFPILRGLAHGLDVVARRSTLLEEVAGNCSGSGRIVPFDDPPSLVEAVGRIIAGESVETVPLGAQIPPGAAPANWREIAARIITFIEELTAKPSTDVYDQRDAALRSSCL
jgi:glycosyltransferase involved in cell wall biosynthesis